MAAILKTPPTPFWRTSKRVLLVDDDDDLASVLELGLMDAGCSVDRASDGLAGLELYRTQSWDAVVVDRAMPHMNGEELAEHIRTMTPDQRIVLITGLTAAIKRPELFNRILGKPFPIADLVAAIGGEAKSVAAA
jgi:DNA-binding response OmpR family regulator